jgi:hypothetical protein
MKAKKRIKKKKLIPLSISAQTLMLDQGTLYTLIKDKKIKIYKNTNLDNCIFDSDLKILCYDEEVRNISKRYLIIIQKIKELLEQYRKDIEVLEKIHNKYKNKVNILNDETALVAAYILFAKVINLLNMVCLCLENFYLNAGSLLRIIDETIDVAEYFIESEGTEKGDLYLKKWFREDVSPGNFICRETLSESMSSFIKNKPEANKETMYMLYHLKSKMIHPTRNIILESLIYSEKEGILLPNSFDYKRCSYARRLYKLTKYFELIIWTAFQGFYFCFYKKMPLGKDDKDILMSFDNKYNKNT